MALVVAFDPFSLARIRRADESGHRSGRSALFKLLRINLGLLAAITVSLQAVVAGLMGTLLFLAIIWAVRRYRGKD